jgi:hypothetical protein
MSTTKADAIIARVPLGEDHEWRKVEPTTKWQNGWALYFNGDLVRGASRFERELLDAKVDQHAARVRKLVEGLAEQQAMPDDWWKAELESIEGKAS